MINVKQFESYQDIYVSPDPQEHRPAWIWFAYIDDDFAICGGRGLASTWYQSAIQSKKGQIHVHQKIYAVAFEEVTDEGEIDKFINSYRERAGEDWDPKWEKNFRQAVLRVKFLDELGTSDLPRVQN